VHIKVEPESASVLMPMLLALWVVLAIVNIAFFHFGRDAKLKQAVFPFAATGGGLLFLGICSVVAPLEAMTVLVPIVAIVTWIRMRSTRFCMSCGKTLLGKNAISPPNFCQSCGAEIVN
jgi:hypothetical protein